MQILVAQGLTAFVFTVLLSASPSVAQVDFGSPSDGGIEPAVQGASTLSFPVESPQLSPPYNLDIIDNRGHVVDFFYQYSADGSGVNVYIMNTGIRSSHSEFLQMDGSGPSRVAEGWAFDDNTEDCVGFGTHAAGVVGGLTYGVAKNATLVPVKIFEGCAGDDPHTTAEILEAGTEWVVENAQQPALVLLLLYTPNNEIVTAAVDAMSQAGLFVVAGSGNTDVDSCTVSPANSQLAMTVAPANESLVRMENSNFGSCIDMFAPGVLVSSSIHTSDDAVGMLSSSNPPASMVAGVAAQFLQRRPSAPALDVRQYVITTSSKELVEDHAGAFNRFLYNGPIQCSEDAQDRPARVNRVNRVNQGRRLEQVVAAASAEPEITISNLQLSQTQPDFNGCFRDFGDPQGVVYFVAQVDVSTAATLLNRQSFTVNNGSGEVLCVNPVTSDACDGFFIQGTVPIDEYRQISIEVHCNVPKEAVKDTFTGVRFPPEPTEPVTAVLSDFRPAGKMYTVNMQYPSSGAVTDAITPLVQLSFSEDVTGISASDFAVSLAPAGAGSIVSLVELSADAYLAELSLQPAYTGEVTVQYSGSGTDSTGNVNTDVGPITFFKRTSPLVVPTVAWDICPSTEL